MVNAQWSMFNHQRSKMRLSEYRAKWSMVNVQSSMVNGQSSMVNGPPPFAQHFFPPNSHIPFPFIPALTHMIHNFAPS